MGNATACGPGGTDPASSRPCFGSGTEEVSTKKATPTAGAAAGSSLYPLVLALVCGVATGVLWAYANPIQLVPGVIQWRIFAFLPPLIGTLFGPRSGFICGYLGTLVWSLLAGTFIPAHSLLVDGVMVGFTGLVPGLLFDPAKSALDGKALLKIAAVCFVVGIVMVAAVSASLAYLGIFPFTWAMLYIGLSDIVPMVIGTPLLVKPALKIIAGGGQTRPVRF